MAQEADLTETGTTATEEERNRRSGRDIPGGSGMVSDEDIHSIDDKINADPGEPQGRDHSTENYEKSMPTSGVGAIQDNSDTTSDVTRIDD
jgi:hypothetical protein